MPILLSIDQVKTLQRKTKRSKRVRPVRPPAAAERILRRKTEDLWKSAIFPSLERIKGWIDADLPLQILSQRIQAELDSLTYLYSTEAGTIIDMWRLATDRITRAKINAALTASLGIDISAAFDEPGVAEAISMTAMTAEELIVTMPTKVMGDVADAVMRNFRGEPLPEGRTLVEQIDFLGTKSKKWAKVIARDQTAKLTASFSRAREQALGVDMYVWRTMRDRRVVGKPTGLYPEWNDKHMNHYIMEGLTCRYDDATVYSDDGGETWKKRTGSMPKNHPATDILCRCYCESIINLDALLEKAGIV